MPSQASSGALRLELQARGENNRTWGIKNNNNFSFVEQGAKGVSTVTITGDHTLTANDYQADESRAMTLVIKGSPSSDSNITIPSSENFYCIRNDLQNQHDIVVKTAVANRLTVTIPHGKTTVVWCDGSNVQAAIDHMVRLGVGADANTFSNASGNLQISATNWINMRSATDNDGLTLSDPTGAVLSVVRDATNGPTLTLGTTSITATELAQLGDNVVTTNDIGQILLGDNNRVIIQGDRNNDNTRTGGEINIYGNLNSESIQLDPKNTSQIGGMIQLHTDANGDAFMTFHKTGSTLGYIAVTADGTDIEFGKVHGRSITLTQLLNLV